MSGPRMSVIMVTPDRFERLGRTLEALKRQSVADRLEIVVVAPSRGEARVDEMDLTGFAGHQVVETGPVKSSAVQRAAGVRSATAPVVAFTEDHCFPAAGWAEALIDAHQGRWAAVGPAFENGNPGTLMSWMNLLIEYGQWISPVAAGPKDQIPSHNSSYKRDLLLAYGDRLEEMLETETVLQWDLRAQGHDLYLEPAARTRHFNFSLLPGTLLLRVSVGRGFGAARAREWSLPRRMAFAAASPLIPLVRFARMVPVVRRCDPERRLYPRVLPLLLAGFIVDGFGEFLGYAFRGGDADERVTEFEYDRPLHMRPEDRQEWQAMPS
ncbi:MAG TPA: glycosyltransferase family A protein [Gemmatimonadota bacterium]|nr:glycosyltransferase family A protein [Gemmatimonadota bacterium]